MNVKQARQRVADLKAEIAQATKARAMIGDAAIAEKRPLTDDERTALAAKRTAIDALEAQLADAEEICASCEAANEAERNYQGVQPDPDAQTAAAALAAAGVQTPRIDVPDMTRQRGYFGRQLQAVYEFTARGGWEHLSNGVRDVLRAMLPGGGIQAAATGLNTDVGSEGGFLVQKDRVSTVMQRAYEQGAILSRVGRIPISANANGVQLPAIDETSRADGSRYGGIVSGWLGQAGTLSIGKPKFRLMDMKLRKVGAFVYATDELLADAVALEGWINRYLPLELTFRTEDAVVNGIGSNQPLGVLNSGAVISVTRAQASRVLSDDLRAMWNRMWAPARSNAVWLVDQSVESEFDTLAIPIGTGGSFDPSYKPAGSMPGQVFATYKGRPIIPVEYCAALGTSGDIVLVALDEYTLIDKGGVDQAVSMHVQFLAAEQVFRFMYRVDGQLNWNAALTPKSGGSTLSVVVKLT